MHPPTEVISRDNGNPYKLIIVVTGSESHSKRAHDFSFVTPRAKRGGFIFSRNSQRYDCFILSPNPPLINMEQYTALVTARSAECSPPSAGRCDDLLFLLLLPHI